MIDLIAAAGIGGITIGGSLVYLAMKEKPDSASEWRAAALYTKETLGARLTETQAAHTRCSDALETARNRIERALEQITPGANATVSRIGRILRGEQG